LGGEEGAGQVDVEHAPPVRFGDLERRHVHAHAGVDESAVERAEPVDRLGDGGLRSLGTGEVGHGDFRGSAGRRDAVGHLPQRVLRARRQRDLGPGGREPFGHPAPDAAAGAHDEDAQPVARGHRARRLRAHLVSPPRVLSHDSAPPFGSRT